MAVKKYFVHCTIFSAHNGIRYKKSVDDQFRRWLDLGLGLSSRDPDENAERNPFATF